MLAGECLGAISQAGNQAVRKPAVLIVRGMYNCLFRSHPGDIGPKQSVRYPLRVPRLERVQPGLRDTPNLCTDFVHQGL